MVPCEEESWKAILPLRRGDRLPTASSSISAARTACRERGMGSAVGQVPEYIEMVARWCKAHTRMPVIVKLTPNITDIRYPARAAKRGGADAVSLINTINSIIGVDLDTHGARRRTIDGKGTHGGYCGPAVKPIALNMVAEIARDPETRGLPISAHRRHHHLARRGRVHRARRRHRAGLHRRDDLRLQDRRGDDRRASSRLDGREGLRARRRFRRPRGAATSPTGSTSTSTTSPRRGSTRTSASNAAAATSPARTPRTRRSRNTMNGERHFEVIDDECVGCNLCVEVCPVENCITMVPLANASTRAPAAPSTAPTRTGPRTRTTRRSGKPPSEGIAGEPKGKGRAALANRARQDEARALSPLAGERWRGGWGQSRPDRNKYPPPYPPPHGGRWGFSGDGGDRREPDLALTAEEPAPAMAAARQTASEPVIAISEPVAHLPHRRRPGPGALRYRPRRRAAASSSR